MKYSKKCKICNKTFESDSKNTVYCSDKCAKSGAKKAARRRKMKHINAVRRGDDKEVDALLVAARKLSRDIAKLCLHKVCGCKDENHVCEGELVCHHIDHDPLNCHPSNLIWLCEKAHREVHLVEEDCSMQEEMKAFITIRKQAEIRKRNSDKQSKVDKIRNKPDN